MAEMSSKQLAERMVANQLSRDRAALETESRRLAETLVQFAGDVDKGLRMGTHQRVQELAQDLVTRATKMEATRGVAELFSGED